MSLIWQITSYNSIEYDFFMCQLYKWGMVCSRWDTVALQCIQSGFNSRWNNWFTGSRDRLACWCVIKICQPCWLKSVRIKFWDQYLKISRFTHFITQSHLLSPLTIVIANTMSGTLWGAVLDWYPSLLLSSSTCGNPVIIYPSRICS